MSPMSRAICSEDQGQDLLQKRNACDDVLAIASGDTTAELDKFHRWVSLQGQVLSEDQCTMYKSILLEDPRDE